MESRAKILGHAAHPILVIFPLVERLGVGVDKGANLDAPSSLSSHAASEMVPPTEPTARI